MSDYKYICIFNYHILLIHAYSFNSCFQHQSWWMLSVPIAERLHYEAPSGLEWCPAVIGGWSQEEKSEIVEICWIHQEVFNRLLQVLSILNHILTIYLPYIYHIDYPYRYHINFWVPYFRPPQPRRKGAVQPCDSRPATCCLPKPRIECLAQWNFPLILEYGNPQYIYIYIYI